MGSIWQHWNSRYGGRHQQSLRPPIWGKIHNKRPWFNKGLALLNISTINNITNTKLSIGYYNSTAVYKDKEPIIRGFLCSVTKTKYLTERPNDIYCTDNVCAISHYVTCANLACFPGLVHAWAARDLSVMTDLFLCAAELPGIVCFPSVPPSTGLVSQCYGWWVESPSPLLCRPLPLDNVTAVRRLLLTRCSWSQ